jgi:hypothetical protein
VLTEPSSVVVDDSNRAMPVKDQPGAHRPEQHPGEPAAAAAADHHHLGVLGQLHQGGNRQSGHQLAADVDRTDLLRAVLDRLERVVEDLLPTSGLRLSEPVEFVGGLEERRGVAHRGWFAGETHGRRG